jgi:3-deoxy-manno-octulosonate cytidylyltransferase (CMP-KDO synthetase)
MEQTPLEIIESVDMNRLLENGIQIRMVLREEETYSVDTIADLERVREKMQDDPLLNEYLNK